MTPLSTVQHLTAARALVADPGDWTKGCAGRDADGFPDNTADFSAAVSFCMLGSLWRALGDICCSRTENILHNVVRTTTRFTDIVSFSDAPETTHADVLRVFDLAIAAAEREEV